MISSESDKEPRFDFDIAVVALGYERRCRWVAEKFNVSAVKKIALEFGFLMEGSYAENRKFFERNGYRIVLGLKDETIPEMADTIMSMGGETVRIFLDISSMSREMIANVAMAIAKARANVSISVSVAYAPSKFFGPYRAAPIRSASPIKSALAGWSSQPERPLGTIFGLGCEPNLALGALQVLEPNKAWVFQPKGIDQKFDVAMKKANEHLADIFDVSAFTYEILRPTATRGRFEALLNAINRSFRLIVVPFGPKIFAWLSIATVVFTGRTDVGVWAFSSKEQATLVDRDADGFVIWHNITVSKL